VVVIEWQAHGARCTSEDEYEHHREGGQENRMDGKMCIYHGRNAAFVLPESSRGRRDHFPFLDFRSKETRGGVSSASRPSHAANRLARTLENWLSESGHLLDVKKRGLVKPAVGAPSS
jgi:hypothetical protein